jgi:hypothetical protein
MGRPFPSRGTPDHENRPFSPVQDSGSDHGRLGENFLLHPDLMLSPRRYSSIEKIRSFFLQNTFFTLFQKASEKNKMLKMAGMPEGG